MNLKMWQRIYSQAKRRSRLKRSLNKQRPMEIPTAVNGSLEFGSMSEGLTGGRLTRILATSDDIARETLALIADTSVSGARGIREL